MLNRFVTATTILILLLSGVNKITMCKVLINMVINMFWTRRCAQDVCLAKGGTSKSSKHLAMLKFKNCYLLTLVEKGFKN